MTTVGNVAEAMERLAPPSLAESFDNVGLLIGRPEQPVRSLMVMLDADIHTIQEAVDAGVDMIVTHHPIILTPLKRIENQKFISLIQNNISLYAAHTNLDSADGGVNDVLAEVLGLSNVIKLPLTPPSPLCAKVGDIPPCTLRQWIGTVKERLGLTHVRYVGDLDRTVSRIGVLGGNGSEFSRELLAAGCDVYVTSDLKYHQAQLADELGICMVDPGHFETENPVCSAVAQYLAQQLNEVTVLLSKRRDSYIKYE